MYALNISADRMILSATSPEFSAEGSPVVEALPDGDITEYRYNEDGSYTHAPQPKTPPKPTQMDIIEAQVIWTAMETGTLLEG